MRGRLVEDTGPTDLSSVDQVTLGAGRRLGYTPRRARLISIPCGAMPGAVTG